VEYERDVMKEEAQKLVDKATKTIATDPEAINARYERNMVVEQTSKLKGTLASPTWRLSDVRRLLGGLVSSNSSSIHKLRDTVGESVFGLFSARDASAGSGESIHTDESGEGVGEPISPMDKSFHADTGSSGDSEGTTAGRFSVE